MIKINHIKTDAFKKELLELMAKYEVKLEFYHHDDRGYFEGPEISLDTFDLLETDKEK